MRLIGYCEKCRKIKAVRVAGAGSFALVAAGGGYVTGLCSACEDKETKR